MRPLTRGILQLARDVKLNASHQFSIHFAPESRKPRDPRPLCRWGVLVTSGSVTSHFKKSGLKSDGVVSDCSLLPVEAGGR